MNLILQRLWEVMSIPFTDFSMLWEVLPLVITIIIMEMYFGRYKKEQIGWNSALSNSLVLIYIGSNLLHYLFLTNEITYANGYTFIALVVILAGLLLALLDFYHILPKTLTFGISSVLPINFLAYLAIVFVHGHLILDLNTLFASLILFLILLLLVEIVHLIQKPTLKE